MVGPSSLSLARICRWDLYVRQRGAKYLQEDCHTQHLCGGSMVSAGETMSHAFHDGVEWNNKILITNYSKEVDIDLLEPQAKSMWCLRKSVDLPRWSK
jgi:hypothetical protein